MNAFDLARLNLELKRVRLAREELDFKILEREQDIARIKEHIEIQLKREQEIEQKLREVSTGE